MKSVFVAIRGKGLSKFLQRGVSIAGRYGMTPGKMDRALAQFAATLRQFECSATFPITAVVLGRNPRVIERYQEQGIEFAIHGYRHIDHCQLSGKEQLAQVELARKVFDAAGIQIKGFRGPYLHANADTLEAMQGCALVYDSSQALSWDVLNGQETSAYRHVAGFYGAVSARDDPSLPSLKGSLVRIPYSLPDDEALVHRLSLPGPTQMNALWLAVLRRSYELGELFTLGLHPERTLACQEPLRAVLSEARQLNPSVWIARLDEIAAWWQARSQAEVEIMDTPDDQLQVTVKGPQGASVLAQGVEVDAPTRLWADGYQQVLATTFAVRASQRPWIGLAPGANPDLYSFLRQQGYIVESSAQKQQYAYYLNQTEFAAEDQRPLLAQIENTDQPLVRLGRWPNGAKSALAVTGDIDALTLWDFGLRFVGR